MKCTKMLAAALLALLPGVALAMGCTSDHRVNACEDGFTWDDQAQVCVEVVSS